MAIDKRLVQAKINHILRDLQLQYCRDTGLDLKENNTQCFMLGVIVFLKAQNVDLSLFQNNYPKLAKDLGL